MLKLGAKNKKHLIGIERWEIDRQDLIKSGVTVKLESKKKQAREMSGSNIIEILSNESASHERFLDELIHLINQ
jgi:hypothetical protein